MLITTDGSDKTSPAILYGLGLAKAMGAEVTAMNVIDENGTNIATPEGESVLYQRGVDAVGSIVAQGRARGLDVKTLVVGGVPSSEIVQASSGYDMIVMGTVGRTGISHLLIGSVAEKVVRLSNTPVLVVHSGVSVNPDGLTVNKILIPTDGSENTKPAISQGLALAKVFGAAVTVLSVSDQAATPQSKAQDGVVLSASEACREATEFVANEGQKMGITVNPLILTGTPSDEIVKCIHRL